ncbi:NADP-dependent oxidoreductase [Palleronia sp. LCG004]|uniref:NADP-dependent oxidoreductase n=1 Tax=Palleronia sp. LCG004 TaxID=3079304 RepID=UPI0029429787|nr:NADP-dependent oxidoreductase [Palleronia sp. LCG004]WOI56157.1 NADP-dependent oxidoreductase [Palleronia sp. LCG004]
MTDTAHRVVLAARPEGRATTDHLRHESFDLPEPGPGEVLLRTIWLSLDPYMRGRMSDAKSYATPVAIDETMTGQTVGEVIASNHDGFAPGDIATGMTGWTDRAVMKGDELRKLDPTRAPLQTALGILGMPGMTAWTGLTRILEAKKGQTIVISAATGAVGSVAGQLAHARGLRVVGVAGGPEKCAHATGNLGYDTCIDHHAHADGEAMARAIGEAAPNGVDLYFENVGGKTLAGVVPNMNDHGRIAICGMVAWYAGENLEDAISGPTIWRNLLTRKLRAEGFIIFDHWDRFPTFLDEVAPMVADGTITYRESVTDGLENAPKAFVGMLAGDNFGKTLVRVGPDP